MTSAIITPLRGSAAVGPPELFLFQEAHALAMDGRCDEARLVYDQYAAKVRPFDPASADLAVSNATTCQPRAVIDPSMSQAVTAILGGDDQGALALLDKSEGDAAWRQYYRGVALAGLHRTDEAAAAFDAAASPPANKLPIAVYAKARAYHDAYECARAAAAYAEYADLVRASNPQDAAMALDYAADCARVHVLPLPSERKSRR